MVSFRGINVVLLDIEGTISSISFVRDVMYPMASKGLVEVLASAPSPQESSIAPCLAHFPEHAKQSSSALISYVDKLVAADVKDPGLKELQGYLWRTGFENGALRAPIYSDVVPSIKRWLDRASAVDSTTDNHPRRIAIFSSGSVAAQKLFLKYTGSFPSEGDQTEEETDEAVDLTSLFSAHFDTINAGPKLESKSYNLIAEELGEEARRVLFLSDNVKEVSAAIAAGVESLVVDRPGNIPLSEEEKSNFTVITSFDQVDLD